MSYTTRCPACGTTFRVVPDQLKISDGWVRCGHCADVFDATLYLEQWTPAPAPAPADPLATAGALTDGALGEGPTGQAVSPLESADQRVPDPVLQAPSNDTPPDGFVSDVVSPADLGQEEGSRPVGPECAVPVATSPMVSPRQEGGDPAPVSASTFLTGVTPAEVAEDFHADLARFAAGSTQAGADDVAVAPAQEASEGGFDRRDREQEHDAAVAAKTAEPGFVRQARRQAFWRSPAVRVLLAVLVLAFSGLLLVQWAVHERDRLAARHPVMAPWLTQLCEPLGCRLSPPRRIEAVVIDSSTLTRRLGNFYAFDVVLKNTADMAVAMPALELSLTDTQDRVIARRVFLPRELPDAPEQIAAQTSLPLNLRLSLADAGNGAGAMSGYRALVFYP